MEIELPSVESLPDSDDHKRQAEWRERSLQKIKPVASRDSMSSVRSKGLFGER